MKTIKFVLSSLVLLSAAGASFHVSADTFGFREIGGTNVPSGTVEFKGKLTLAPEATYMKTGAGTLEISSASLDDSAPYRIDVLGGKLQLEGSTEKSEPVAPDVAQKAAIWLDVTDLPMGDLQDWPDVRGGTGRYFAQAKHSSGDSLSVTTNVSVIVTNGVKCVYCGGHSKKFIRFRNESGNVLIEDVVHYFVVHGVEAYWGAVLGNFISVGNTPAVFWAERMGFVITTTGKPVPVSDLVSHFHYSSRYGGAMYQSRMFLDGRVIDPYSVAPRRGFQLIEGDMLAKPSDFGTMFYNRTSSSGKDNAGGDYLCEVMLFTNRLSEVERLEVERYLMKKWNLPAATLGPASTVVRTQMPIHRGTGTLRLAEGASAEISVDDAESMVPLAFEGSGDVLKTGSGTMVIGAGASRSFTGDFTLQEGSVLLRGGMMPPVSVSGGETYSAAAFPSKRISNMDGGGDVTSGVRVVRSVGGTSGVFRKTGSATVAVKSAASDVARIEVAEGMLQLAGTDTDQPSFDTGIGDIEIHIPNHSFEMPFDVTGDYNCCTIPKNASVSSNGWYSVGSGNSLFFVSSNPLTGKYMGIWVSYLPPDGDSLLMTRGLSCAETDVVVPRAGTYELSFFANSRYGIDVNIADPENYAVNKTLMDIKFNGSVIGRTHVSKNGFVKYRYIFEVSEEEAGVSKRLGFYPLRKDPEQTVLIDDVHLRSVACSGRGDAVKVPGGDFETSDVFGASDSTAKIMPYFSRDVVAEGWDFSLIDESLGTQPVNGFVAVVNGGTEIALTNGHARSYNIPVFPYGSYHCGASVLGFIGSNGKAEMSAGNTFVLPAGRWRLRAKAAMLQADKLEAPIGSGYKKYDGIPSISAKVITEDSAVLDAGSASPVSRLMKDVLWTGEIALQEAQSVRVSLVQTVENAICLVDDLEFVPVDSAEPEVNLFPDPGCEKASLWTFTKKTQYANTYKAIGAVLFPYNNSEARQWGCDVFDGDFSLQLRGVGCGAVPVTFPAAGLYRLTFNVRSRASSKGEGCLPLRGYVTLADGTEKEIFRMSVPYVWGFHEYSFLFEMPESGTKTVGIHGFTLGDITGGDRSTFVDGISIVKVNGNTQKLPEIPITTGITVSEGARMALDYPGTLKVQSLVLGGTKCSGTVDASSAPDYLTGMGRIEVLPPQLIIIFK